LRRRRLCALVLAPLVFCLLTPMRSAGDGYQARAATESHLLRIRGVLAQRTGLDEVLLDKLAQSVLEESRKHALDPMLLLAVIHVESAFDHRAVSSQGAQGLMQLLPVAVAALIEERKIPPSSAFRNLKDPVHNVKLGASYLASMKEHFGDLKIALTAYNAGPTRTRKKIAARETISFAYADRVLSVQRWLENEHATGESAG
jgi:soluble lytic murein transglycosylase-like protein